MPIFFRISIIGLNYFSLFCYKTATIMEDLLDEFAETEHFTDKEIIFKIWTAPRPVFKYIDKAGYSKYVTLLLVLQFVTKLIKQYALQNTIITSNSLFFLIGTILCGVFISILIYFFFAILLRWTGSWMKGEANTTALIRVIAYSLIPMIFSFFLLIPGCIALHYGILKDYTEFTEEGALSTLIYYAFNAVEYVLLLWSIVLCIVGISQVQNFSLGKSVLNFLLAILVVVLPLSLIIYLFNW